MFIEICLNGLTHGNVLVRLEICGGHCFGVTVLYPIFGRCYETPVNEINSSKIRAFGPTARAEMPLARKLDQTRRALNVLSRFSRDWRESFHQIAQCLERCPVIFSTRRTEMTID
ncbi:unnamed protein product [Pieris brassicae]|uniref:Uncharacterized protein n=1 Tax=Pieris brassicae TaxID=7116 RepID=A0A9P0TIN6_PIEBR|nr:unnamed protein product [Pieris brassicae]